MRAGLLSVLAAVLLLAAPAGRGAGTWPNDPAWPGQWGSALARVPAVWAKGTGVPEIVIAIVDTGVAPVADLDGALVPGIDLVGGGVSQGGPNGFGYHGTWVASIVAARGNNARDVAGYCWRCSIMPVRVSDGISPVGGPTVAVGIRFAVDHGADIVNVSLAGGTPSPAEEDAVAYAHEHGVLVVSSAGNTGDESLRYPGAYPGVLAVAATDENDRLYPWSTRGAWVPLAAPGCAIVVDPLVGPAYGCGSSFAPAAVAGIAGLLLSFDPSLTADQIAAALRSSAHAVDGIGGGRVDAAAAFAALALPDVTDVSPPAPLDTAPAAAAPAPAPPLEVTALQGALLGARAFSFDTGPGRVVVRFAARPAASCQVRLELGKAIAVGLADRGVVTIDVQAPAGRRRVTVTCSAKRSVAYSLEIAHPSRNR